MEYTTIPIKSARRNPYLNPKISVVEQLRPYYEKEKRSGLSKYYFTFTTINKVGIKPKSAFDTPLGVYAYPMIQMYSFLEANEIPFAGDREFINLLELNVPDNKFLSQSTTESQADLALKKLEELFKSEANKEGSFLRKNNKYVRASDFNKYVGLAKESYPRSFNTPYGKVWNVSHYLAEEMFPQNFDSKTLLYWNILLRKIGFEAAVDYEGEGFIHPNERFQAVFFSKKAIKHLATFDNKKYDDYSRIKLNLYSPNTSKDVIDLFNRENNTTIERLQGRDIVLQNVIVKGNNTPNFISGTITSNIYDSIIGEKRENISVNTYDDAIKLINNPLCIGNPERYYNNVVKHCLIQDGIFNPGSTLEKCRITNGLVRGVVKDCKIINCSFYYDSFLVVNVSKVTGDSFLFRDFLDKAIEEASNEAYAQLPASLYKTMNKKEYEDKRSEIIGNRVLEYMRRYFSIESLVYLTAKKVFK